jgi:hypothetical protein
VKKYAILIPAFLLAFCHAAECGTKFISGVHSITYDIINPKGVADIPEYSNESFSQKIIARDDFSKRVVVTSTMKVFNSASLFPVPDMMLREDVKKYLAPDQKMIQSGDPAIIAKARELTKGARTLTEVGNRIANFVMDHLTYVIDTPQDAVSALRNSKGSCQGFTNLSIALLRASGVPARVVLGYLPPGYDWGITKDYWGVKTSGGGFHAWYEVYFPDLGWVFTDGQHSKNFVDPFHILIGIKDSEVGALYEKNGKLDVEDGTSYTLFSESNDTTPVDDVTNPSKEILGRMPKNHVLSGRITGTISDDKGKPLPKAEIILWQGNTGAVNKSDDRGRYQVFGLKAGEYDVTFQAEMKVAENMKFTLANGEGKSSDIKLAPAGEIEGKVILQPGKVIREANVFLWTGNEGKGYEVKEDGSFAMQHLKQGKYRISLRAPGYSEEFKDVEVKVGAKSGVSFGLEKGATVHGRVVDSAGQPIASGEVYCYKDGKGSGRPIRGDSTYSVENLGKGKYKIEIRAFGFISEFKDIEVKPGDRIELNFKLREE